MPYACGASSAPTSMPEGILGYSRPSDGHCHGQFHTQLTSTQAVPVDVYGGSELYPPVARSAGSPRAVAGLAHQEEPALPESTGVCPPAPVHPVTAIMPGLKLPPAPRLAMAMGAGAYAGVDLNIPHAVGSVVLQTLCESVACRHWPDRLNSHDHGMGWASDELELENCSIRHYDGTGRMIARPVTQLPSEARQASGRELTGKADWPM